MEVREALAKLGIKTLKPKFKDFVTNTKYGTVVSCDRKFPRPFADLNWCPNWDSTYMPDQALFNKIYCCSKRHGNWNEDKPLKTSYLFYGLRNPGEFCNPEVYDAVKDFIVTFWGQEPLDMMVAEYSQRDDKPWQERKGGVIRASWNPETGLVIVDGSFSGIPACMFIIPNENENNE